MGVAAEKLPDLPPNVRPSDRPIVVYEQAVHAIQQCSTILEAKYWNNKAEALAAWAKIYADDRVEREARQLKLHAYRQIGRLASQLQPQVSNGRSGTTPGPRALLIGHGISSNNANTMVRISKIPEQKFQALVDRPKPPAPSVIAAHELARNPAWSKFKHRLSMFRSGFRTSDIEAMVASMHAREIRDAKEVIKEAMDLLGELHDLVWQAVPSKDVPVKRNNSFGSGSVSTDKGESITTPR